MKTILRALFMAALFVQKASFAGFGGMGNVEGSDVGPTSISSLFWALIVFTGLFYAAARYIAKEGNEGAGRVAIGIIIVMVVLAILS